MFVTPLLVGLAPHFSAGEKILAPLEKLLGARGIDEEESATIRDHVVIVGFGLAARLAAQTLRQTGVDFFVLEINAENVRKGKALGLPVYYGDATSEEALRHAHIEDARMLVLLMSDLQGAHRVVDTVRRVAPKLPILVRTRYLAENQYLESLGAHEVVAEEVEGAVEVIARMLRNLEVPRNVIEESVRYVRAETLTSVRKLTVPRFHLSDVPGLENTKVESFLIEANSVSVGKSLQSLAVHRRTGALVIGQRRDNAFIEPTADSIFVEGDVVFLLGRSDAIVRAAELLNEPREDYPEPELIADVQPRET